MAHDRSLVSMFTTAEGVTYALRSDGRVVVAYHSIERGGVEQHTWKIAFGGRRMSEIEFARMKAEAREGDTHGRKQ